MEAPTNRSITSRIARRRLDDEGRPACAGLLVVDHCAVEPRARRCGSAVLVGALPVAVFAMVEPGGTIVAATVSRSAPGPAGIAALLAQALTEMRGAAVLAPRIRTGAGASWRPLLVAVAQPARIAPTIVRLRGAAGTEALRLLGSSFGELRLRPRPGPRRSAAERSVPEGGMVDAARRALDVAVARHNLGRPPAAAHGLTDREDDKVRLGEALGRIALSARS